MQEEVRLKKKTSLALAIVRGQSITSWASQNEVPLRTAYRWSRDPQVRGEVQACHSAPWTRPSAGWPACV
jgi:hypothetical protein